MISCILTAFPILIIDLLVIMIFLKKKKKSGPWLKIGIPWTRTYRISRSPWSLLLRFPSVLPILSLSAIYQTPSISWLPLYLDLVLPSDTPGYWQWSPKAKLYWCQFHMTKLSSPFPFLTTFKLHVFPLFYLSSVLFTFLKIICNVMKEQHRL